MREAARRSCLPPGAWRRLGAARLGHSRPKRCCFPRVAWMVWLTGLLVIWVRGCACLLPPRVRTWRLRPRASTTVAYAVCRAQAHAHLCPAFAHLARCVSASAFLAQAACCRMFGASFCMFPISAAMDSLCCKRRIPELPEPPASDPREELVGPIPRAPLYDDQGFCLTPTGRNRRPRTYDTDSLG